MSSLKVTLNPDYSKLKPLVENIETYFQQSSRVLHQKRNEIRVISYNDEKFVVKKFRVPNPLNQFVYRFIRPSKAQRSYEYSLEVGKELCPEAIAFIEEHQGLRLLKSYYISRYFDFDYEIRAVLSDKSFADRKTILQSFAEFTYQLHEKNILHRDYSPGNILIKRRQDSLTAQAGQYQFKIVDVNRMQFKVLSIKDRLENFVRLSEDDDTLNLVIKRYAECIHQPVERMQALAKQYCTSYNKKRALKNRLRGR